MALKTLSGTVQALNFSTEIHGSISGSEGNIHGSITSSSTMNFRVDGKPAQLRLRSAISIDNGDKVTLVGNRKKGTFHARAIYNETTGAIDSQPAIIMVVLGLIIGIPGIPIAVLSIWILLHDLIIGLLFVLLDSTLIAASVFFTREGYKNKAAIQMLERMHMGVIHSSNWKLYTNIMIAFLSFILLLVSLIPFVSSLAQEHQKRQKLRNCTKRGSYIYICPKENRRKGIEYIP